MGRSIGAILGDHGSIGSSFDVLRVFLTFDRHVPQPGCLISSARLLGGLRFRTAVDCGVDPGTVGTIVQNNVNGFLLPLGAYVHAIWRVWP